MGNIQQYDNTLISKKSVFFEKLIEHRFIADIMMYGWYFHKKEVRILRCEIDSSGYDIIIDCDNKYRFIQLRTSISSSKRSYQHINASLIHKENPCIIWIFYNYNDKKNDFEFKYLFWGADIDEPLPHIISGKKRGTAENILKSEKNAARRQKSDHGIAKGQFEEVPFDALFGKLFGI